MEDDECGWGASGTPKRYMKPIRFKPLHRRSIGGIMSIQRPLSTVVIRDLIFEVFRDRDFCKRYSSRYDFFNARGAHQSNLFMLVEHMAIEKGLIDNKIAVCKVAWGASGCNLYENHSTNFSIIEIERLWEAFYLLLNNHIIAPGMYGTSPELPYFHITSHGEVCIENKDILPYDIDGYINKLRQISGLDEWIEFYMLEALKCYNANCCNAATAMIGLSSEVIIEVIIIEFSKLLGKTRYDFKPKSSLQLNGKTIKDYFDDKIKRETKISKKYEVFTSVLEGIKDIPDDLISIIDKSARDSFFTFLRLNRNEVTHCLEVKKDNTEVLLLFMSFIKYCTLMTAFINKFKEMNN